MSAAELQYFQQIDEDDVTEEDLLGLTLITPKQLKETEVRLKEKQLLSMAQAWIEVHLLGEARRCGESHFVSGRMRIGRSKSYRCCVAKHRDQH